MRIPELRVTRAAASGRSGEVGEVTGRAPVLHLHGRPPARAVRARAGYCLAGRMLALRWKTLPGS